jgi:glycosyltransferase involved in cell wall biosynthesis
MQLLFINRFYFPDEAATAQLLTMAAEDLVGHGCGVTIIAGQIDYFTTKRVFGGHECRHGVRVLRVWSTAFGSHSTIGRVLNYLTFYAAAAWAALRRGGVDCIVVWSDPPLLSVLAVALSRLKGWKSVVWMQDLFPDNAVQAGFFRLRFPAWVLTRSARWSLRRADHIVVVGRCMKRRLAESGVAWEQMTVISNWADGASLRPVPHGDNWFRKEHAREGQVVVMYSGHLGVVHDWHALMHVLRSLSAVPDVMFLFVCHGPGREVLEGWVRREGLVNVGFIEHQPRQALTYSLSAADVHLVTLRTDMAGLSVPSKTYGIMAVGRPIVFIGPKDSEAAMAVMESGCGVVVDPEEPNGAVKVILELASDRRRRQELGAAGRRYFDRFFERKLASALTRSVLKNVVR